jgi:hypothetical protein
MTPPGFSHIDNPPSEQFYYRAHRKDAEFSPDDAWSLAIDGDSEEERGYSAFRSLPELHAYISSRKYPDLTDSVARGERIVIRFTGDEVGQGADGEPLVVPHNSAHSTIWALPGHTPGQLTRLRHLIWDGPGNTIHLRTDGPVDDFGIECDGIDFGPVSGPCHSHAEAQHAVDTYLEASAQEQEAAANIQGLAKGEIPGLSAVPRAHRDDRIGLPAVEILPGPPDPTARLGRPPATRNNASPSRQARSGRRPIRPHPAASAKTQRTP